MLHKRISSRPRAKTSPSGSISRFRVHSWLKWGNIIFPWGDNNGVSLTLVFICVPPLWADPVFVGSAYIEESQPIGNPVGDDDKIYFFFSEAGKEFDFFDNTIVSRIARVCKVSHPQLGRGLYTRRPCKSQRRSIALLNPDTIALKRGEARPCQSTSAHNKYVMLV